MAKTAGDQSLGDLCQSKGGELAKSEDITKTVLTLERQSGPGPPAACAAVQKACAVSFQTWSMRSTDAILGLLVGKTVKKRLTIHSVLVGKDLDKMLGDSKLEFLRTHYDVSVHGLILPDPGADGQEMALKMFRRLSERYPDASLCILAPWLPMILFLCIHLYIYTYITIVRMHEATVWVIYGHIQFRGRILTLPWYCQLPKSL